MISLFQFSKVRGQEGHTGYSHAHRHVVQSETSIKAKNALLLGNQPQSVTKT